MPLQLPRLALLSLAFALPVAHAQLLPDTAVYSMTVGGPTNSTTIGNNVPDDFGTHSLSQDGAVAVLNLAPGGASFAMGTANNETASANLIASTNVHWMVESANNAPVLLNITISGWFDGRYAFTPDRLDTYNLQPNYQRGVVKGFVRLNGGSTELSAGLQTGGYNMGVTRIDADEHFTLQNGGYSTLHGSFSQSFSVWAQANTQNTLGVIVGGDLYKRTSYLDDYASETWQLAGAARVTIAAAYPIDGVTITAVPEPGSAALAAAGLLAIGLRLRRRAG